MSYDVEITTNAPLIDSVRKRTAVTSLIPPRHPSGPSD
jgi:hypothetical protein